jgi:hypothetical protein
MPSEKFAARATPRGTAVVRAAPARAGQRRATAPERAGSTGRGGAGGGARKAPVRVRWIAMLGSSRGARGAPAGRRRSGATGPACAARAPRTTKTGRATGRLTGKVVPAPRAPPGLGYALAVTEAWVYISHPRGDAVWLLDRRRGTLARTVRVDGQPTALALGGRA